MNEYDKLRYIAAFTYGDGYVSPPHGKNSRFMANNVIDNRDYIEWRADILSNISGVRVWEEDPKVQGFASQTPKRLLRTSTNTHPLYTDVRSRMYGNNVKRIDPHYLKMLDWETLAILVMDDGSTTPSDRVIKGVQYVCTPVLRLATHSFTYGDNVLLKRALAERLGLEFNINQTKSKSGSIHYYLVLQAKFYDRAYQGMYEFVKPSFMYKLAQNGRVLTERSENKRKSELSGDTESCVEILQPAPGEV